MSTDAFRRRLEAIAADYRRTLPGRLAAIEARWRNAAGGAGAVEAVKDLQRELHEIAGSAKTLGVSGVSEIAAQAEAFLEPYCRKGTVPPVSRRARLEALLAALRQATRDPAEGG